MLRIRSYAAAVGVAPALAVGAVAAIPAPSHPTATVSASSFRVAISRHYGQPGNASGYSVIAATGHGEWWAFGGTNPGGQSAPIAVQWNGKKLLPSRLPAGLSGFISDASALSQRDIWAASEYGRYVLRRDGQRWTVARRWSQGLITGLTAVSADDVWVFGIGGNGFQGTETWHFDGRSWASVPGPASTIYRASAVSRRDIWAITTGGKAGLVLRFNGSRWRRVRVGKALNGVQPRDILALSRSDVWVLGNVVTRSTGVRLVLVHWNGETWTRIRNGMQAWAGRLAPGRRGSVLVTATPAGASAFGLILQATVRGWESSTRIMSPQGSGVSDVTLSPDTRSLLASGGILTRLGGDAAIWVGPANPAGRHGDHDA